MMKYIIDTDPGIDDAIAIIMGVKNKLDIIGFTLATGNVETKKSENNLKVIQDFLGTNIKMYHGGKENESREERAQYAHGKDGLGYAVFPINNRKFEKMKAEDFIIKASKKYKEKLTVVCFGPLTNLAQAIKKDKNLYNRIDTIVIMGASWDDSYNEFNFKVDPEATNIVLSTPFKNIKVVTHEIGVKSFIEKQYILDLRNSDDLISRFVSNIAEKYMDFSYDHYGTIGLGTPDPTTIASIIDPEIIKYVPCDIKIISKDGKTLSQITEKESSNIYVSKDFDLDKFRYLFKNTFK